MRSIFILPAMLFAALLVGIVGHVFWSGLPSKAQGQKASLQQTAALAAESIPDKTKEQAGDQKPPPEPVVNQPAPQVPPPVPEPEKKEEATAPPAAEPAVPAPPPVPVAPPPAETKSAEVPKEAEKKESPVPVEVLNAPPKDEAPMKDEESVVDASAQEDHVTSQSECFEYDGKSYLDHRMTRLCDGSPAYTVDIPRAERDVAAYHDYERPVEVRRRAPRRCLTRAPQKQYGIHVWGGYPSWVSTGYGPARVGRY